MAAHEEESILEIARSLLADTRELVRDELDLMRAEIREEAASARDGAIALGGAAFAGVLGLALLCVGLGNAIAYWFAWPAWAGYVVVSLLLFVGAYIAMRYGRKRLAHVGALPNTRATLKENLTWIQSKSARR